MEVRKNWFYWIIASSVGMLLALGTWWLYLVFKLSFKLTELNHPALEGNLVSMVKWEGATFILFLFVLSAALFYIYLLDLKKTKALQAFFASLTHELKTPLASMKLQTEVLCDLIENSKLDTDQKEKLSIYTYRLLNDSVSMEDQLDNHLQLSRVERDSPLNLRSIELSDFVKKETTRFKDLPEVEVRKSCQLDLIQADDYALQTVLRNLFENTRHHQPRSDKISISIAEKENYIMLTYNDSGDAFKGDSSKLGDLFYKFNSPKGSGIGLYLTRRLMQKMGGVFKVATTPELSFTLLFKKALS